MPAPSWVLSFFGAATVPPMLAQVPFGTYFHSAGLLSPLPRAAQACFALPQSFCPALAMP